MDYGISTHLYHDQRLCADHLREIAVHGFRRVELFATRTHFDYHAHAAIAGIGEALAANGLTLHSMHAPIVEGYVDGKWGAAISLAASDPARRELAVRETQAVIALARDLPYEFLVVHMGVTGDLLAIEGTNSEDGVRESLERIAEPAEKAGVRLAIEVIPNDLSLAGAIVELIEDELDLPQAGICLDFGHAELLGDLVDAVEEASGLIVTTHVHDNRGKDDDHLVPFEGTIDWAAALTAMQKVGYEGTLMFEIANYQSPGALLARAGNARRRFEQILGGGFE